MFYIILQNILLLFVFIKSNRITVAFISFVVIIFYATSYAFGYDWGGYFINYRCVVHDDCTSGFTWFEPGFNFLTLVFGSINFQFFICAISIFNVIFVAIFSKNFFNRHFVFLFFFGVYGWFLYTEAIRQALALSLSLPAIYYLFNKNIVKFIIIIGIASTLHSSALFNLIFLFPLFPEKFKKIFYYFIIAALIFCVYVYMSTGNIIYSINIERIPLLLKVIYYLTSEMYAPNFAIGIGLIFDVMLLYYIYIFSKNNKNHENYNIIMFSVCVYIFISMLVGRVMPVFARLGYFCSPFLVIILSLPYGGNNFIRNSFMRKYKIIVLIFIFSQIFRPFIYEHARIAIFSRENIFLNSDVFNDDKLLGKYNERCALLIRLEMGAVCGN